jgi:hypothetical protein
MSFRYRINIPRQPRYASSNLTMRKPKEWSVSIKFVHV